MDTGVEWGDSPQWHEYWRHRVEVAVVRRAHVHAWHRCELVAVADDAWKLGPVWINAAWNLVWDARPAADIIARRCDGAAPFAAHRCECWCVDAIGEREHSPQRHRCRW